MKKETARRLRLVCFAAAWLLMLAYPVARIIQFECPSEPPTTVFIKVNGFDPYDPFRGNHLRLNSLQEIILPPETAGGHLNGQGIVYAVMETDEKGVATFTALYDLRKEVPDGALFIKVEHYYCTNEKATDDRPARHICRFRLPFEHFYLNEKEAPKAEELLRSGTEILLKVKIYRNGDAVAEDVLIDGKSVYNL